MKCSKCNNIVPDGSSFCNHCGNPIEKLQEETTIKCEQCGNIIPADSILCRHCGNSEKASTLSYTSPYVYVPNKNVTPRHVHSTYTPTVTRVKEKEELSVKKVLIGCAIFILLMIIIIVAGMDNADSGLTPVAEPRSGTILSGVEYYSGSNITITAASGESCVVKLKTSSDVEVMSFYVRAGETVTVGVPNKYLYVYFASGKTWYGTDHLFGKNTSYSMDDDICDFTRYTWEYTLYPVSSGNFSQTPIDEDKFR